MRGSGWTSRRRAPPDGPARDDGEANNGAPRANRRPLRPLASRKRIGSGRPVREGARLRSKVAVPLRTAGDVIWSLAATAASHHRIKAAFEVGERRVRRARPSALGRQSPRGTPRLRRTDRRTGPANATTAHATGAADRAN